MGWVKKNVEIGPMSMYHPENVYCLCLGGVNGIIKRVMKRGKFHPEDIFSIIE